MASQGTTTSSSNDTSHASFDPSSSSCSTEFFHIDENLNEERQEGSSSPVSSPSTSTRSPKMADDPNIFEVPRDTYISDRDEENDFDPTNKLDEDVDEQINEEQEVNNENKNDDDECAITKKARKKTSHVWEEYEVVTLKDGTKKAQCKHCRKHLLILPGGVTSHFIRHLERCTSRPSKKQRVLSLSKSTGISVAPVFRYDHERVMEKCAHMILMHEYPFNMMEHVGFNEFIWAISDKYQRITRHAAKDACFTVYEYEKKKVKNILKDANKISITTDLWKSDVQKIHYMVVTAHLIDSNWNLQKHVLNFFHLPPPGSGLNIYNALCGCLVEWEIEDKVSTITVDNCSANDVCVRHLKEHFSLMKKLSFAGKIFHVRCCAHIVNLLVQDGYKEISNVISNIRTSVKYLSDSDARLMKFSEIARYLKLPAKKLILDVCTRWNSVHAMLSAALEFKDVFPRYAEQDPSYKWAPSVEEWRQAEIVCEFLEVFSEVTNIISGSEYPTANLYLPEVWRIKAVLDEKTRSEEPFIQRMALVMKEKFDKYWGECNLLMAIAAVLDPRCKLSLVEYTFPNIFSHDEADRHIWLVRDTLRVIFDDYAREHTRNLEKSLVGFEMGEGSSAFNTGAKKGAGLGRMRFKQFIRQSGTQLPTKSELDIYLEESVFICDDDSESSFSALEWWKANTLKFRILSQMARDILSIPITTVASEAAFSAGSRVIDPYRGALSTDTVEVLLCAGDWIRTKKGLKKKVADAPSMKIIDLL